MMNAQDYFYEHQSIVEGNTVDILFGGEQIFPALINLIEHAQYRVHLQIYEFMHDGLGQKVADALIHAVQRGCDVKVMYDYWGSCLASNKFFKHMQTSGVEVKCYHSLFSKDVGKKFFKRNHRKMLLVDDGHAMIGGFNIADVYQKSPQHGGIHDMSLIIHGPVYKNASIYFDEVWEQKNFNLKAWKIEHQRQKEKRMFRGKQSLMVLGNNHLSDRWRIRRDFLYAFSQAQKSIWIMNPYFIPDPAIVSSLIEAVKRGISVKLIVPQASDVSFVDYASKVVLQKIIKHGVEVYRWPGFSHGKAICVDKLWLSVGSYNFDYRSLLHNLELVAHTSDQQCVPHFVRFYEEQLLKSRRIDKQEWTNLNLGEKTLSRMFYRLRAFL